MKLLSRDIFFKAAGDGPIESWDMDSQKKSEIQKYIWGMQKYLDKGRRIPFDNNGVKWTFQSALKLVIATKSFPPVFCSCISQNSVDKENFDLFVKQLHWFEALDGRCEAVFEPVFYEK